MKTILMVAEKPSLALSIAKILSRNSLNTRKSFSNACPVHEYTGNHLYMYPEWIKVCANYFFLRFGPGRKMKNHHLMIIMLGQSRHFLLEKHFPDDKT